MSPRIDYRALAAAALGRFDDTMALLGIAGGRRQGREYQPLNPLRPDHKPGSFTINMDTGAWADFAADAKGGDLIALAAYLWSCPQAEAARRLAEALAMPLPLAQSPATARSAGGAAKDMHPPEKTAWRPILPVPDAAPPPPAAHPKHGAPSMRWDYRDGAGRLLGAVLRFEAGAAGERKQFFPLTWCEDAAGRRAWRWQTWAAPRPLYGLDRLAARPAAPAVLVEGEKAADAAAALLPDYVAVTWPGGAAAVGHADFAPLAGRDVLAWADADAPGAKAMSEAARRLAAAGAASTETLDLAATFGERPSGWDAADAQAEGWTTERLAAALRIEAPPPPIAAEDAPAIVWAPGELPALVDEAQASLRRMPGAPILFQRGGQLVRLTRRGPTSARTVAAPVGALTVAPVDAVHLVELLTSAACWQKLDRRSHPPAFRAINCPGIVAQALLSRGAWAHAEIPPLVGVVQAPTLRPDGSVLAAAGYDERTGLFVDFGATRFAPVIERPSVTQAAEALGRLADIVAEFPFATDVDRSVALALLLTALVRPSLPAAPLFGLSATVMGSGKTLLLHAASMLTSGRPAAVVAPPRESEEEDKVIFAALLEGQTLLGIDNYERIVESDLLCVMATSEEISGRVLGSSRTATVPTLCTVVVTGNNLTLAGDLTTRALVCHLDPKSERPEARRFARDLGQWIPAQRGALVPDALTFLRGWISAADHAEILQGMDPWQRFPAWSDLIRGALVWAGYPDPLDALRISQREDPRRLEHEALMTAWRASFGADWTTARKLEAESRRRALVEDYALRDALLSVAGERGEINQRRLGRWCAKLAGRRQGGLMIERGGLRDGAQTWRVAQA
jgi:putative DNA primase/helicase